MARLDKLLINFALDEPYVDRVREQFPDLEIVQGSDDSLTGHFPGADALFGGRLSRDAQRRVRDQSSIRWIHAQGAGVDGVLGAEIADSEIVVTNSSGVHASNSAEHVLAFVLAFARNLPRFVRNQPKRVWLPPQDVFELSGQTLAILGLGEIGKALAVRANALGMRVRGLKRDPESVLPPGVEYVYGPDRLHEMLSEADHVAICLPLTSRTRGWFDRQAFAAMREGAYFYNIGRGAVVDQAALIEALQSGRLGGAGLDVTEPEPLEERSPLWTMRNVIITSHTAGITPHYWERALEILVENIRRYREDRPLLNLVSKQEGY